MAAAAAAPVVSETKAEFKKYRAALLARIVYTAIKPEFDKLFEECTAEQVVSATSLEEIDRIHSAIKLDSVWGAAKKFAELRGYISIVETIEELDVTRFNFYRDALAWHRESKHPWKIANCDLYGKILASHRRHEDRPLGDPEISLRSDADYSFMAAPKKEDWANWCRIWRTVAFTMVNDGIVNDDEEADLISSELFGSAPATTKTAKSDRVARV
jgi:hypothetical protein